MSPPSNTCAACGAPGLVLHLRAAGSTGEKGLIPSTDQFGTALADIVRCPRCTHMQLAEFPPRAVLAAAYVDAESADYIVEEEGQRETARRILNEIGRWAPTGSLLDLGCWVGFFMAEAKRAGWQVQGVEPSRFASDYARRELGLNVATADIEEVKLEEVFDVIFLGDVIEHLIDPGAALGRIARHLTPDGLLALTLPDAGSRLARVMGSRWWSVLPTHVQYFTRGSLATLLRRHGYEPLVVRSAPKAFTVRYYVSRLAGYSPPLSQALLELAGGIGLADRVWAPDFRDRILMIARGPSGERQA